MIEHVTRSSSSEQTACVTTEEIQQLLHVGQAVRILYTNYKGQTGERTIIPRRLWLGETQWHPGMQLLVDAFDVEKQMDRSFAIRDIHKVLPPTASPNE